MHNVRRITQAYTQAPWRRQIQLIGLFLLVLILAALVAGVYLNLSARAGTEGREIQELEYASRVVERQNEDLRTQLAFLTSESAMEARSRALGYRPASADEILYIVVPGYVAAKMPALALPPAQMPTLAPTLAPEYTESLFDWLRKAVFEPAAPLMENRP